LSLRAGYASIQARTWRIVPRRTGQTRRRSRDTRIASCSTIRARRQTGRVGKPAWAARGAGCLTNVKIVLPCSTRGTGIGVLQGSVGPALATEQRKRKFQLGIKKELEMNQNDQQDGKAAWFWSRPWWINCATDKPRLRKVARITIWCNSDQNCIHRLGTADIRYRMADLAGPCSGIAQQAPVRLSPLVTHTPRIDLESSRHSSERRDRQHPEPESSSHRDQSCFLSK
jgi:hypothetical protein